MRTRILPLLFLAIMTAACFSYYAAGDCILNKARCFDLGENPVGKLAPERYRVLQRSIESLFVSSEQLDQLLLVDIVLQSVLTLIVIPVLYLWLRKWVNADRALVGAFLFAVLWIASFHFYFRGLSSTFEILFTGLALVTMGKTSRNVICLVILTILATLNRETSLILPLSFIAFYAPDWRERRYQLISFTLLAAWVMVVGALHITLGYAPHVFGNVVTGTLEHNLDYLPDGVFTCLLVAPLLAMVVAGYRVAPTPLKRLFIVALLYFVAILVGGGWGEMERLILPPLILVLPMTLYQPIALAVLPRDGQKS